jgi:uncharacterized membrane protein
MMPHVAGPFIPDAEPRFDVERLAFFSDAVVAIAITLLVIQLSLPTGIRTDAQLRDALIALAPGFFSFFGTFAVTGLWWSGHHRLMRVLTHADGPFLVLNFMMLAGIAFLPFSSGVVGHHGDLPSALILYAATNCFIATTLAAMRLAAARLNLLRDGANDAAYHRRTASTLGAAGVFGVSIPLALVSPDLAILSWYLVLAVVAIRAWDERRRRRPAPAPSEGL